MSARAKINAPDAGRSFGSESGAIWISTFSALREPAKGLVGPRSFTTAGPNVIVPHACWCHLAAVSISSMSQQKLACSPSPEPNPISNLIPANTWRSFAIRSACGRKTARRGVSNLTSFVSAFVARSNTAASLSFDLRCSSLWRLWPMRPNWTSIAMPNATSAFATADPHCSKNESYGGWYAAMAISAATPKTTSPAPNPPQRSQDSPESSNSFSLAFITPSVRRHAGKAFDRGFLFGAGSGALIFLVLLAISY